jgi:molybdenum cofactor synthesis domain-containing protein
MSSMRPSGGFTFEIIATGDEILLGRIVDTNSSWIAARASEMGAHLRRVTCVGDDIDEIGLVLKEAIARGNDLVILTGGLGPSEDDITIEAVGRIFGRKVEINPKAVEMIREKCVELGVEPNPRRERMARLLSGSEPISNPVGMATGMLLREGVTTVVALPGVPQEMKGMFDEYIAPFIWERATSKCLAKTVTVRIVWSDFFPMYRALGRDHRDIYLKNHTIPPLTQEERKKVRDIAVHIVVEAASEAKCDSRMSSFLEEFGRRVRENGGELIVEGP